MKSADEKHAARLRSRFGLVESKPLESGLVLLPRFDPRGEEKAKLWREAVATNAAGIEARMRARKLSPT